MSSDKIIDSIVNKALSGLVYGDESDDLGIILRHIDEGAKKVAGDLGAGLSQHMDWNDLGWIFGQYRGTILSGERQFSGCFHRSNLGNSKENDLLLGIYWKAFGLGTTLGEMFERECSINELLIKQGDFVRRNLNAPKWNILCCMESDCENYEIQSPRRYENNIALTLLRIPNWWRDFLIQDKIWNLVEAVTHSSLPEGEDAINFLDTKEEYRHLVSLLKARRDQLTAELVWRAVGTNADKGKMPQPEKFASKFLSVAGGAGGIWLPQSTTEEWWQSFVTAIELLSLYWKWSEMKGFKPGPLYICVPRPGEIDLSGEGANSKGLQPRLGVALLFASIDLLDCSNTIPRVLQLLPHWNVKLDAASEPLLKISAASYPDTVKSGLYKVLGKEVSDQLFNRLSELHLGGQDASALLLERICPLLDALERIAPSCVHEGRRFAVNILVGLPYHEQILGMELGDVELHLEKLREKIPKKCIDIPKQRIKHDYSLLQPLVNSCYSLFDWDGVILFGRFSSRPREAVNFARFRRLSPIIRGFSPSELYRQLTLENVGLFALCIDRAGTIRVYYGGSFLLYKQQGPWRLGAAVEKLREMLKHNLELIGLSIPKDLDFFDSFVNLLLRISGEPNVGAFFIIARDANHIMQLSEISPPPESIWKDITPFSGKSGVRDELELLYRLSIMDGATAIVLGSGMDFKEKWQNAHIQPRKLVTEKFDLNGYWNNYLKNGKWYEWTDILSYGAKHSSAFALAMESATLHDQKLLVITVSGDGPISFMVGGTDPVQKWPNEMID